MLNLALFLFAFEGDDLVGVELLVREQVFINKERRPCVRRGVARLLGGEMGVFPVGQLLALGDLLAETDGVDLLEAEVEYAVLGHHVLDVHAVGRGEVPPAA